MPKFYQQMVVQFTNQAHPNDRTFWSVSNWGPGAEATPGAELRGGLKSSPQPSHYMAGQTNQQQINAKIRGGFTFYCEYSAGAGVVPPPKLLAELGLGKQIL